MREFINKNFRVFLITGAFLIGLIAVLLYSNPLKNESKYPSRFQKALGDVKESKSLVNTKDFYIQYYPNTETFTVILYDLADKDNVKKRVETYFKGYGFEDLSKISISYCKNNPANIEKQQSRWECNI